MDVRRTPDERFEDLPDFDFEPHYLEVADGEGATLRIHYLDEGPPSGEVVLLLHGEPSWSYLYRRMIPVLTGAGKRVIAPDLVGFGRSDKPTETSDYTYARHVDWMREALFTHLHLDGITMFCQDWGGLIGLRLVAEEPDRFDRVCVANTGLPVGHGASEAFIAWRDYSQNAEHFPVGMIVAGGTVGGLSESEVAAYDAPFPDQSYTAGARIFPALVPMEPDNPAVPDNVAAWESLERFDRPFLVAFSDGDPITRGGDRVFHDRVPGTAGQPHTTIEGAGHFLQEDKGPLIAEKLLQWMDAH
ncbi:MAG: haloalkane dehalogenase [Microthrixaceae bacterium]|nr:haloalkane dehalogenase [Microthrixaceae bacterium]